MDDWRSATEYHGYNASDAVIVWWWRALKSFSKADRAKVLSFATGTAKVPLGGFAELPVRFFVELKRQYFAESSTGYGRSAAVLDSQGPGTDEQATSGAYLLQPE